MPISRQSTTSPRAGRSDAASHLHTRGYTAASVELTPEQCDYVATSIPPIAAGRGGLRGLLAHPTVVQMISHEQLGNCLWSEIGRDLVAVKATLFDKTADSNWRVQWHQDRVIAVRDRLNVDGFGPWTAKLGVPHVEPPTRVLEQMIAARIYLDDCDPDNGPLRVIPGSHLDGKLDGAAIEERVAQERAVELCVARGAVILMRPLLLHASVPARVPMHRRVLHIEFAPPEVISPLQWHSMVPVRREIHKTRAVNQGVAAARRGSS